MDLRSRFDSFWTALQSAWQSLFDEDVRAWPLALSRIGIGLAVTWEAQMNLSRVIQYTPGQFHLKYVDFITGLPPETYTAVCDAQYYLALAVAAGILTRFAAAGALACQGYLFLISALNFRNHVYLMLLLLLILAVFRSDRVLSVWAAVRWGWRKVVAEAEPVHWFTETVDPAPTRLLQSQILIVYGWAALHKIHPGFLNGYPLSVALEDVVESGWSAQIVRSYPEWQTTLEQTIASTEDMQVLSMLVVVTELLITLTLPSRSYKWLGIALGLGMHASIALGLNVYTFGTLMVSTYPLFAFESPGGRLSETPAPGGKIETREADDESAEDSISDDSNSDERPELEKPPDSSDSKATESEAPR